MTKSLDNTESRNRAIIAARFEANMKVGDIAAHFGISERRVYALLARYRDEGEARRFRRARGDVGRMTAAMKVVEGSAFEHLTFRCSKVVV